MTGPGGLDPMLRAALVVSAPATALVTGAVARGWTGRIDRAGLEALAALAPARSDAHPAKLVTAARDLVALGGDLVRILFVLACLAAFVAEGRPRLGVAMVAIFGSSRLALHLLKRAVRRPRPDPDGHGLVTFTSSFPSGHTLMAVVTYLSGALLLTHRGPPALVATAVTLVLVLGLAIGAVRVAFRVHWPSDVIAGWLAGIAWTAACFLAFGPAIWG